MNKPAPPVPADEVAQPANTKKQTHRIITPLGSVRSKYVGYDCPPKIQQKVRVTKYSFADVIGTEIRWMDIPLVDRNEPDECEDE